MAEKSSRQSLPLLNRRDAKLIHCEKYGVLYRIRHELRSAMTFNGRTKEDLI